MASAEATHLQTAPKPSVPEHFMHKNRLQEYTQRSALPLPLYQTINEGTQHAPKFRASVLVDGTTYWSCQMFSNRKAAEQDVARVALEGISRKIKDEGCPIIREDTVFCKSILNEFAVKMNLEKPTYVTSQPEGLLPIFISSLVFNGRTYIGGPGRSKREAEQLAARTVIQSILGNSESRTLLSQIIKSKSKLYAALQYVNQPGVSHGITVAVNQPGVSHGINVAVNQPGVSHGSNVPVNQPGVSHCINVPLNQPGISHGSNVPVNQPGVSHGINVPLNQPGVSHGINVAYGGLENSAGNSLISGSAGVIMPTTGNMPQLSIVKCPQALPSGQPANAQAMLQAQSVVKKPKEEVILEVSDGPARNVAAVTIEALPSGSATPTNVASGHVDESQHAGHNVVPNAVPVPLPGPSAVSLDSQAVGVDTGIGKKRRVKEKKNKSKKTRTVAP
ncbi:hypothetical protein AAC387_Pa10g1602 [Persea americana]